MMYAKTILASAIAVALLGACATQNDTPERADSAQTSPHEEMTQKTENKRPQKPVAIHEAQEAELDAIAVTGARVKMADLSRQAPMPSSMPMRQVPIVQNRENYAEIDDNDVTLVAEEPVSTFSIDVDTGSYSNSRRMLNNGQLPPSNAVRVEEFVNYFDYDYAYPANHGHPFAVHTEIASSPYRSGSHLLHIGLKGKPPIQNERPPANLVFLLDVSGSMNRPG